MAGGRVVRAVAAVAASVLLPGCWLQPGADGGQTRSNPVEHRLTTANVAQLREAWSADISAPDVSEPLVDRGRIYVGRQASETRGGGVVALDAATGATVWDRTTTPVGEYVNAHPATIVEGEVWSSWWQGFGEPGRCEFGTVRLDRDGTVVGEEEYGFPVGSAIQSGRYVVQVHSPECPSVIAFPTVVSVRDSRTLETLWTADSSARVSVSGGQVLGGDFFPLAGCDAPTCAPTAPAEWSSTVDQPYVARPGTDVFGIRGGFGGPNGEVFALSRATGEVTWRGSIGSVSATLAADDDHLYVATSSGGPASGRLLAFDIDGCGGPTCQPVWSAAADPDAVSAWAPTVAGGVVYVAGPEDTVRAYAADGCGRPTCPEIGRVTVNGPVDTMAVAGGRLFVKSEITSGSADRITAFAPATSP